MSCSFTKQELAQHVLLKSWMETTAYKNDLHLLPKQLNESAAYLHLLALGAVLTVWTDFWYRWCPREQYASLVLSSATNECARVQLHHHCWRQMLRLLRCILTIGQDGMWERAHVC